MRTDLTVPEIVELLQHLDHRERKQVILQLVTAGVDPKKIIAVVRDLALQHDLKVRRNLRVAWWTLAVAAGGLSAFHGYRRNRSVGWSAAWFVAGTVLPVPTIVIAIAQGYAQRKQLPNEAPRATTDGSTRQRHRARQVRLVRAS